MCELNPKRTFFFASAIGLALQMTNLNLTDGYVTRSTKGKLLDIPATVNEFSHLSQIPYCGKVYHSMVPFAITDFLNDNKPNFMQFGLHTLILIMDYQDCNDVSIRYASNNRSPN
ncbi:hypothetical protein K450DRAFT_263596 [Umbelopsis ramanniana AG]|uniref:Uncharacterized protein n=1 Tax=Umbelopsis ramanniana AG TaxID=1314678 RepID=A0AAD5E020_UMBRA|nr:uncharacterized protein K450DRAFT_263596 [Umbelopsis ramanniana AG]KAI8575048.1 hypothetical protein K450DRAFT_263596 [Umbelopsis ramanniana AG]